MINGMLLPLWGTVLGSFLVFFIKNNISDEKKSFIIALSSGIMLSSAIWSLLIPSLEQSTHVIIPLLGYVLGIILLMAVDRFIDDKKLCNNNLMTLSIVIHNIPEGLAVGVAFAGITNGYMSFPMAIILSIGIAIQNIPEGAIISIPLYTNNHSKAKSFFVGFLSGIVEPISAFIAFYLTQKVMFILPFVLSLASGTMLYVIIKEMLPSCYGDKTIIPFSIGFLLMIILEYLF